MAARQAHVREALNALDAPAAKQQVVEHAESVGADEEVVRSLRAPRPELRRDTRARA